MSSPAAVRAYANLPAEVPEAYLQKHCDTAKADVVRATGHESAPDGVTDLFEEAVTVRALASALPWMHTFAMDGAAKVGRLEGTVEARFLNSEDVDRLIARLGKRYTDLLGLIPKDEALEGAPDAGGIFMTAI